MRLLAASARKPAWDMRVRAGLCKKWIANPAQMQAGSIDKFLIDADPFRLILGSQYQKILSDADPFDCCLGRRQLERRLMALSGLSPRDIKGLSRFQRTVRCAMLESAENPASLAVGNGYYDQAHFIRDFQKRVGSTPHLYLKEAREKTHFYNTSVRPQGMLLTPHSHV